MEVAMGRTFISRLDNKDDLLGALIGICIKEQIKLGVFSVIGALEKVKTVTIYCTWNNILS